MKIYSVQYPSGGFGHFIHTILSRYGDNFLSIDKEYEFGIGGNSHDYPSILPKYHLLNEYPVDQYNQKMLALGNLNKNITAIIDSGIDNDSLEFLSVIPADYQIRICYDDYSWALLGKLFYSRCMASFKNEILDIDNFVATDTDNWGESINENWAIREKYFLFLRDHSFRHMWRAKNNFLDLPITNILDYNQLFNTLNNKISLQPFEEFYCNWYNVNQKHFQFYLDALAVFNAVKQKDTINITHIQDLYTQAVVYYFIWLEYGFEVPHNDYSNWFTNTKDIITMLDKHGVQH